MVPNAPWISPIWAASRTAARAFSGLTRMFMVCLLAGPGRRRPLRRLSRPYAPMRRFEIADRVRFGGARRNAGGEFGGPPRAFVHVWGSFSLPESVAREAAHRARLSAQPRRK